MHGLARWLIKLHFTAAPASGGLPGPLFRGVRRHVDRCAACREVYARHIDWERLLPDAAERTGARLLREALARTPEKKTAEQRSWLWGGSLAAVAAAALVLVLLRPAPPTPGGAGSTTPDGMQTRGPAAISQLELLARPAADRPWAIVDAPIAADSELAFRLDNAERYPWLLLVIVDSGRQVHFLYPARPGQPPLAIGARAPGSMLPDAFSPALAPGPFTALVLFSHEQIQVDAVEQLIRQHGLTGALDQLASRGRAQRIAGSWLAPADAGIPAALDRGQP